VINGAGHQGGNGSGDAARQATALAGESLTLNGSVSIPMSNHSVGVSASSPNFSSEKDQGIDAFFPAFDAMLASLESRLEMMDPQLSLFISMFNGNLDALETMAVKK
jgi:hypothetical protein